MRDHQSYLERLRAHGQETLRFLSNPMKVEREKSICRAFLRCLGVQFDEFELIAPCAEPVDVQFRDARFQIVELLGGRRRGAEWKERVRRWEAARSMEDLMTDWRPPVPMKLNDLTVEVVKLLAKKQRKYGPGCRELDALVHIAYKGRFLKPPIRVRRIPELRGQGWRTVSVVFPPYAIILHTMASAPTFLRNRSVRMHPAYGEGLYDQAPAQGGIE